MVCKQIKRDTKAQAIALYNAAQFKTDVLSVEPETAEIIKKLQSLGCIVIGLTARDKELAETTVKQLLSVNVDFNQGTFKDIEAPCVNSPENGIFKYGIMFCDGASKGMAFKGLMEQFQINPNDVYFIDDILRHVEDMKKHTDSRYTGIHYTHIRDKKPINIDLKVVDMQIKYLNKILPDPVAKVVHEHHESETSNTHLKLEFKQKNSQYKPYAYFWWNHQKDHDAFLEFFKPEETKPKIKSGFYHFRKDHAILAYRVKVPLEKAAPLIGYLYQNKILKEQDIKTVEQQLRSVESQVKSSKLGF
jgi:hypothetical protein